MSAGSDPTAGGASPAGTDPDLLARWIAIAALLASAEDLQSRGGGAWPALALIAADTANEAILGTIAAAGDEPPERDATFDRVYHLAVETLRARDRPMPESIRTRVMALHRQRNAAIHLGVEPGPTAVARALVTAADLRSLAVDALTLLEAFRTSGPVRAVAELVSIEPLSGALVAAERHLAADEIELAADQCAIALDAALERVQPGLRSYKGLPVVHEPGDRRIGFLWTAFREQTTLHEAWILALGIGLRPAELRRLQRIVGDPIYDVGERRGLVEIERSEGVTLTRADVEWAIRTTVDVVFRLWQGGSLSGSPWPYDEDE